MEQVERGGGVVSEAGDAMRRMVADQINALNALSDIVRKQAGATDFSAPGAVMSRATAVRESSYSSGSSAPARVSATQARSEPAAPATRAAPLRDQHRAIGGPGCCAVARRLTTTLCTCS